MIGISGNCFGIPPKKNNQNIFTVATMQLLKFFFNPNKPKQLPAPTPIPKEFVCKEKVQTIDPQWNPKVKDDNQIEREIKEELDKEYKKLITQKYSNKKR